MSEVEQGPVFECDQEICKEEGKEKRVFRFRDILADSSVRKRRQVFSKLRGSLEAIRRANNKDRSLFQVKKHQFDQIKRTRNLQHIMLRPIPQSKISFKNKKRFYCKIINGLVVFLRSKDIIMMLPTRWTRTSIRITIQARIGTKIDSEPSQRDLLTLCSTRCGSEICPNPL
ncbi:unnamed protein product [Moneuplotes crassus]|uniref:Uncharacterized protein n=1 Tax=Euplotes crassus TaxID=5936 RepID=A0AAD1XE89_EUPCR|nr:unnamed protein product [Moneuplotes crassus]